MAKDPMAISAVNSSDARRLAKLMRDEGGRAMSSIRRPGYPRPFYLSFLVRDQESWSIKAKYGTLSADSHSRERKCFCDVHVGSYRNDQVQDGGLNDNSKDEESYGYTDIPFGRGDKGIQHGLWRLTDARYREAVESYSTKKSFELTYLDRYRELPSFQRHAGIEDESWATLPEVDRDYWVPFVEKSSALICQYPQIKDSHVRLDAHNQVHIFTNTEGSLLIQSQPYWSLKCYLWLLSPSGDAITWTINHFVTRPSELPSLREFNREIRNVIHTLELLAAATTLRSYAGPVLLDPVPAGLLIHEAIGHRLEGNRMLCTGEGQTFRDSMNSQILPPFLTICDNPLLSKFQGKSLVGHYRYDDEGIPAQNAKLVNSGVLRQFLMSRAGIAPQHRSNGHARCESYERPISRMGVTMIDAVEGLTAEQLKGEFVEEIKRQGLDFGIRIMSATGGETATEAYNFQAFLGEINLAAKVFPDGREQWIRGVDFVGTPLNAASNIRAARNQYEVDNAYCGAESGWVPVSTISPALIVSHLELQSKSEPPYSQYCYPMPWQPKKR